MNSTWEGTALFGLRTFCLVSFFFLFPTLISHGQNPTDCANAVGVCSNGSINESSNGPGINDFAFPGNNAGCLVTVEHQSVWLYVQVESGSTLGFTIIPRVFGEDYDFAVYGPNVSCMNLGMPVRCSYAAPFGSSSTGMNGSSSDLSEGASGNGYVRWLNVTPGESYYVLIDNFSASFQGFSLNWTGDAILDCSVTLPCPELDLGPNTSVCDGASIELGGPTGPSDDYLWSTGETTPSIMVSDSGTYWLEVRRNNCTVRDSIQISLATTPYVDLGEDTLLCEGTLLVLSVISPEATGYLWQDGYLSPNYPVTTAGTYSVQVFNENCVGSDQIVIDYDPMPVVDLGKDTIICDGTLFMLVGTTPEASNYLWQDGSIGITYNVTASGIYWLQTSNTACSYIDSIRVGFEVTPQFDLGEDRILCECDTITLNAYSPYGSDYAWNDSSSDSILNVSASGSYSVEVRNFKCSQTDSVMVTFLPYPALDLGPDTVICEGNDIVLVAYSPLATEYLWLDGSSDAEYNVVSPGLFGVTVTNQICSLSDSIRIDFDQLPVFSIGPDTLLCRGAEYVISVEGQPGYVYTWQDNSSQPEFTVREEGEYYLAVENSCGVRVDTVIIHYGSCNCDFYFPTGFTPNNDGINDLYLPISDCDSLQYYRLEIFNRWGELLFETDDPDDAWPASDEADRFMMDAYVWQVQYSWTWRGEAMIRREKGFFSIIR